MRDICMNDIFDEHKFCYVPLESGCSDKRTSKFYSSVYWSFQACSGTNEETEETSLPTLSPLEGSLPTLSPLSPLNDTETVAGNDTSSSLPPSYHKTWTFSSEQQYCFNYCHNSERCTAIQATWDNGTCHLSTKQKLNYIAYPKLNLNYIAYPIGHYHYPYGYHYHG